MLTECQRREKDTCFLFSFISFCHLELLFYIEGGSPVLAKEKCILTSLNSSDSLSESVTVVSFSGLPESLLKRKHKFYHNPQSKLLIGLIFN